MRLIKPNINRMLRQRNIAGLISALGDQEKAIWEAARDALVQIGAPATAPLIAALKQHPDLGTRQLAAAALGGIKAAQAVDALILALDEKALRVNAAFALGEIRDERAIAPLIRLLSDDKEQVQALARQALGQIGTAAVVPLIDALQSDNVMTRRNAAWVLLDMPDPRALEPLIKALGDQDATVRQYSAVGLGRIGDSKAVEPLLGLLSESYREALYAVGNALDALGWKAIGTAYEQAYWVAKGAGGSFGSLYDMLQAGNQGQGAVRETRGLLDRYTGGTYKAADIEDIPCERLFILDALWRHFSGGRDRLLSCSVAGGGGWATGFFLDREGEYEYLDHTLGARRFKAARAAMSERLALCLAAANSARAETMMPCPQCGRPIHDYAVQCSHCSHWLVD
jgi:HEAT repeat protein